MDQFNTPAQIIDNNIKTGINKVNLPKFQMILLGIIAGMFIALGGSASSLAMHGIEDVGLARTVAGAIFPCGLMLIILVGGELFTGNCLISIAVFSKKVSVYKMISNLVIVYFSNMIGATFITFCIYSSGQFDYSTGGLGAFTIKVALGKVNIAPDRALLSGMLCNILVCLAIFMAGSSKDVVGKILAIFFPIWVFVISGFEHCVANMFYIPAGIFASKTEAYVAKAQELYGITPEQIEQISISGFAKNLLPVTIGNIIGGMIFVGLIFFLIHTSDIVDKPENASN